MIEAEVKARVHNPEVVLAQLEKLAEARIEVYQDTYFDQDGTLFGADRELRVRTQHSATATRSVLTYKEPRVDEASGSKPEWETGIEDPAAMKQVLARLGYRPALAFEKRCRNYRFAVGGREVLATLVQVPELDGTFVEVETQVAEKDLAEALALVRSVLRDLGIGAEDETNELYTDAVRDARSTV